MCIRDSFYLTAKFRHCSMCQSKVRAENVQHTRPCCEPSWMWHLRYEKICLLPEGIQSISLLKSTYFPLSIVHCFYSMYFIIGVIVKFLLQQRLQLSSTCCPVATWTSRTEAVVYVIKMRSLWFSDDSEYVIVEKSWARRVEAIDLFFIQK